MSIPLDKIIIRKPFGAAISLAFVLVLWAGSTLLQALFAAGQINESWNFLLAFLPGLGGLLLLAVNGIAYRQTMLEPARLSAAGLAALALSTVLMVPVLLTGRWTGWNPREALIYAPGSAIAQELLFRVTLLPFLFALFKSRLWPALLVHSALFGLWHISAVLGGAPPLALIGIMGVPFLAGLAWGWQVLHDHTAVWAIIYHALILIGLSFFTW